MIKRIRTALRRDALRALDESIRELNEGERHYLLKKLSDELGHNPDLYTEDGELNTAGMVFGGLQEVLLLDEISS